MKSVFKIKRGKALKAHVIDLALSRSHAASRRHLVGVPAPNQSLIGIEAPRHGLLSTKTGTNWC